MRAPLGATLGAAPAPTLLQLNEVSFGWPEGGRVIERLSLDIAQGEKVVLLGANGCGKSTLLKLLNGLVFADRGELRLRNAAVTRERFQDREFARRFRRDCVLLFQHPEAMLFNPTVKDEIAYGPRQLGLADVDARVARWARELRLDSVLDKPPFLLSGGEKQKVALACLLALDPQLLLLDEPAASLDPRTTGWLVDRLVASPMTVIASTHNLSMAAELGTRCLVLGENCRLLYDGPVRPALENLDLMEAANLAHRHTHRHGSVEHVHVHVHDWEA